MKKILLVAILFMNLIAVQTYAQCEGTHLLCKKQLSKEDKKAGWNVNKQSESLSVEKGETFEMFVTAYQGLEYRLSVCTDIHGGTPVPFQVAQDMMVNVTDSTGNTKIEKQRKVIFDNAIETEELYVLFRSNKTEKFYLTIGIPSTGISASKKLKKTDFVCLGVLLEHRKTKKSAL
ncbi:MAG: hypothetical protein GQ574_03460 [Crocinitomix sp.]|nr:hypothetical protein [Crocinitomix sp.]